MVSLSGRFRALFLPGLVFQSVLVGGGYATGRELVEFFLSRGPWSGLIGMMVTMLVWSVVLGASLEFARVTQSYDYRAFFRELLGRAWPVFEAVYAALILLVLSVLGAATGELATATIGTPPWVGVVVLASVVGLLAFQGREAIERFFAAWSFVLYAAYVTYFALWMASFGDQIAANFRAASLGEGWIQGGVTYASYNVLGMIAVLFCARHLTTRRDALIAGALAGPLALIPGVLFFIAMVGFYPEITEQPVPVNFMLEKLEFPALQILFQLVLFGTFVETGLGLLHSVNERIAFGLRDGGRMMPRWLRPVVAMGILAFAVFLATNLGIIDLVAKGYGSLTYAVLAIYVLPILSVGIFRIIRAS